MKIDLINNVIALLPSIVYAVSGLIAAVKRGEKVSWPLFFKTIIVGAISAGLILQETADLLLVVTSSGFATYICDKLLNAIFRGK